MSIALAGQPVCDADRIFAFPGQADRYKAVIATLRTYEVNQPITSRSLRYIPVVVHVIASPGVAAVSLAQALHQIDVLNQDFSGNGENLYKLPAPFRDAVGEADIRFCLATTDPEGLPTSGITYTPSKNGDIAFEYGPEGRRAIHYDQLGGKSGWDPSRYINVWVVDYKQILGSATLPGVAPFDEENGIVINAKYFGSYGDAGPHTAFDGGHTLTHEMGHYLGLLHIWGQGFDASCDDSDSIDDTPNAAGPNLGCPSGEVISCGESNMYQNFMDFTDDFCLSFFTHDQVTRMQATLAMYYPQLGSASPCSQPLVDEDAWYDQLTWTADVASDRIIVFHPQGLATDAAIQLFSADGRLLTTQLWAQDLTAAIDMSSFGPGVYIVCITAGGQMQSRKIAHY